MQHPPQRSWRPFALGLGSCLLIAFAFLAVGHFAHAAVTIENVGGSLGLGAADLKQTILNVVKLALGLLGLIAVIVMIYGGFVWLTSRGDEKKIDKAKRILLNGAIGLVIILVSWAIVLFIQRFITNATGSAAASGQCKMSEPAAWGYCNLCDDAADPLPDYGLLYPDPTCIDPELKDYYAIWEDPADTATNVKLCQAVSAGFGGLIQTAPNPPFENDINPTSDFSVYRCTGPGSGASQSCATTVKVNGAPVITNNVASLDSPDDFVPNSKYYVDVTQVQSVDGIVASRPIPPDGWTFLTGTENDEDPPTLAGRCSDDSSICLTDADCGAGNTCSSPTSPSNGETIQCLSPIIEVQFSEGMYPPSAMNPANMVITRTDAQPTDVAIVRIDMPTPDIIQVTLNKPLVKNVTYRVTLSADNGADSTKGYRDTCSNALDCGNGLGVCTSDGTATGATPLDDYRFDFTTADTDTVDCSPIVTSISSPSFHGNQGDPKVVTITGSNFGLTGGKQVRFSGNILATQIGGSVSQCFSSTNPNTNLANQGTSPACIQSVSPTEIRTIVPTGPKYYSPTGALDGGVVVIKGTQESPLSTATTDIQSPHISGIYPREGKAGRFVTIQGDNFGGSGRVRFRSNDGMTNFWADDPSCPNTPNNWSNNLIIVQVPEGFAENAITNIQVCGKGDATCTDVANISNTSRFDYKNIDGPNLCGVRAVGSTAAFVNDFGSNNPSASLEAEGDGFGTILNQVDAGYSNLDGVVTQLLPPPDGKHLVAGPNGALPNGTYNFFVTVNGRTSNFVTYRVPADLPPQVVQDASCKTTAPTAMPSPNPYPGSTDVCRNSRFQVRFNQAMVNADVTNSANVLLEQCGTGSTFTCDSPVPLNIFSILFAPPWTVPTYTPVAAFTGDTWYRVTLRGANIHSAVPPNVALGADYVWTFHVRADPANCAYDAVVVSPSQAGPLYTYQTQQFQANPTNAQCALLTGIPGDFTWNSNNISLATVAIDPPPNPNSGTATATVPTGTANGTATIRATLGTVFGEGLLSVQRNYCDTDADCQGRWNDELVPTYQCTGSTCNVATHECRPWIHELQSGTQVGPTVNGPAGNLIDVRGCFFGNTKGSGEVTFTNISDGTLENGSFEICGPATWTNDSIRVQAMPKNAANGSSWSVQVIAGNSLQSTNTRTYNITNLCSTNLGGTTGVPTTGVPILCGITPPAGREGDSISYSGDRFVSGSSQAFFTQANGAMNQLPLTGGSTAVPSTTAMTSQVPALTGIPTAATTAQTTVGVDTGTDYCIATPVDFAVSCNQNSECSTGCCQMNICQTTSACWGLIGTATPAGGILECRNQTFQIDFNQLIQTNTLSSATVYLFNTATPSVAIPARMDVLYVPATPPIKLDPSNSVVLTPTSALPNGTYRIYVKGGAGGVMSASGEIMETDFYWPSTQYTVNDSTTLCKIARVEIQPTSDIFTCSGDSCAGDVQPAPAGPAGNQHQYTAFAFDGESHSIGIQDYAWSQGDGVATPGPSNVYTQGAAGTTCPSDAMSSTYCAQSLNVANGSEALNVDVVGMNGTGTGSASITIQSFMCTQPWPAAGAYPFRDPIGTAAGIPSHDFTFGFCTDSTNGATLGDPSSDLVQSPVVTGEVRKEYFMFVEDSTGKKTGDSIGVRIIGSPLNTLGVYQQDLSPKRWYERTFGKPSSGTTFEVDGYPALREGRTVYVVADYMPPGSMSSFPAVYVFSHTDNAQPETVQIFEQIMKSIRFNNRPGIDEPTKVNLRNDLKRFHAMHEVVYAIAAYYGKNGKNPVLDEGTYIKNMTMTPWPSWQQEFGRVLGVSLPTDPQGLWDPAVNLRLLPTFCTAASGYNQTTCWNEKSKLMQFPSNGTNPPESTAIAYVRRADGKASVYSTGSIRSNYHNTVNHNSYDPPLLNICTDASVCQGFNLEILSDLFDDIDNARQKPPADMVDPVITSITPLAGVVAGAVTFVATATDNVGVNTVTFAIGGESSTVVTPSADGKYRWTWNSRSVLNQSHTLTVTATDRSNNDAVATRTYTVLNPPGDNLPPKLADTPPPDQDGATGIQWNGSNVTLTATAAEDHALAVNNTGIAKIEFFLGSSKIGQSPSPECAAACTYTANVTVPGETISGFPNGTYTYTVVAYDGYGNTSARTYTVTVAKTSGETIPPTVSIILPSGAPPIAVSGANTDVVATASDTSGIDRVEFSVVDEDTAPRSVDFNSPYSFSWDLAGYANGSAHTVRAVAYDRYGNEATATQTVTYNLLAAQDTQRPTIDGLTVTVTLASGVVTTVPMEGAQLKDIVTLRATLTDNQAVAKGELRIDGVKIPLVFGTYWCDASGQVCTIAYPWNTLVEDVDQHTVSITAYDNAGFVTTVTNTVSVTNQVLMTISSPLSGTTVQDSAASGHCSKTTSRTCTTSKDCPATSIGFCELNPGAKCTSNTDCVTVPGDTCIVTHESCIGGGSVGVPVVVTVTDTCGSGLLLSAVDIFLDNVLLQSISNCNGSCSYIWNSKATTSNGAHVLTAIGQDSSSCKGGDKSNIIVNNVVNDTVPPVIDSLSFNGAPWPGTGSVTITGSGLVSVLAHDPPGGSGMELVTIAVNDSGGTQLAQQTCNSADVLAPNPCQFAWVPNDGGGYQVVVNARDVAGNDAVTRTQVVNVDSTAPQIVWSSPAGGSTVNSPPDVTLTADATDPQTNGYASGIASVVFRQNGIAFVPSATGSGSSYSGTYPLAAGASQLFSAVVTDQAGNTSTTPNVSLTVTGLDTTAPVVSTITSPSVDNWYFKGTTTITAAAVDNSGGSGIGSVQFYIDGAPLGAPDTAGPYTVAWDTTTATDGQTYSITARACDRAATPNCLTSNPRLMRVWNSVGTLCRTVICPGATPYCCTSGCSASSCTVSAL